MSRLLIKGFWEMGTTGVYDVDAIHMVSCQCLTCLAHRGQWNTTATAPLYFSPNDYGRSDVVYEQPPKRNLVCARCAQGHGSKPCKSVLRKSRKG